VGTMPSTMPNFDHVVEVKPPEVDDKTDKRMPVTTRQLMAQWLV